MDNEDFGRDNPTFQRYIPSCYGNYQKYIPSFYLMEKDGMPEKDTIEFYTKQVIDGITYRLIDGKWVAQVSRASRRKVENINSPVTAHFKKAVPCRNLGYLES